MAPEKEEVPAVAVAVAEVEEKKEVRTVEPSEIDRLKKALVTSFRGTNRGLSATSETRAKIIELITQLEAKNPTPAPTVALTLLNGKWILALVFVYTVRTLRITFFNIIIYEHVHQKLKSDKILKLV